MTLIDYDAQFERFFEDWYEKNKQKYKKPEEVEDAMPGVYAAWSANVYRQLNAYTAQELVNMISEYISAGQNVPDIICDTIVRRKPECEQLLMNLYNCNMFSSDGEILLINMLAEMDSALAVPAFLRLIATSDADDGVAEAASEALQYTKNGFLEEGLKAYEDAYTVSARELLLNAMIAHYKDERLLRPLIQLFDESPNKAFVAAMMGEYGDERCLDVLRQAEYDNGINYMDYTEICNAIEALGGETLRDREFEGDACYDLKADGDIED